MIFTLFSNRISMFIQKIKIQKSIFFSMLQQESSKSIWQNSHTSVVIAHILSINSNIIYDFNAGEIVEMGIYELK